MDYMKAIKIVACAMLSASAVSAFASSDTNQLPTIAEIDSEIAGLANQYGARTLWREFVPTVGRIKNLQDRFPTQEVLQVQWHVVSNMFSECCSVATVTNGNQVNYQGMEWIVRQHLTKFMLFHVDTNALMYVADCVSSSLPVDASREKAVIEACVRGEYMPEIGSTNALTGQPAPHDYNTYTNRVRLYFAWRHLLGAKIGFNQSVKRFRQEVFNCFCTLILCEFVEYPETVRQDIWEEFCRRAGASDDEKSEAYNERHVIRVSML